MSSEVADRNRAGMGMKAEVDERKAIALISFTFHLFPSFSQHGLP